MLRAGAHVRVRTGDLFLTKEVLCLLSYVGPCRGAARVNGWLQCCRIGRSSATIGQSTEISDEIRGQTRPMRLFGWEAPPPGGWWAGRESNPHSRKTADLQSAELTTCSTYPRIQPARGVSPASSRVYPTPFSASTEAAANHRCALRDSARTGGRAAPPGPAPWRRRGPGS
jgi:hypothetical protein